MNRTLGVLLAILLTTLGQAQRYNFKVLSINDGLAQSSVSALAQDDYGYVWAGTHAGLSRFDGLRFRNFGVNDGLPNQSITDLVYQKDQLWVGTERGLCLYDGTHFILPNGKTGLNSTFIVDILPTKDGVYAVTEKEIYFVKRLVNGLNVDSLNIRNFTSKQRFQAAFLDRDQNLWVSSLSGGIYVLLWNKSHIPAVSVSQYKTYSGKSLGRDIQVLNLNADNGLKGNNISCMLEAADGSIWYADWRQGLGRIDFPKDANQPLIINDLNWDAYLLTTRQQSIYQDSQKRLWFASDGFGMLRVDPVNGQYNPSPTTTKHYFLNNGVGSNHPTRFLEDREHNMWIGTANEGLVCLTGERFVSYIGYGESSGANTLCVYNDRSGNIWSGTYGSGIMYYHQATDSSRQYLWPEGISESIVTGITEDQWGGIWAATTGGGISILPFEDRTKTGKVFKVLDSENGLPWDFVTSIATDRKGVIWAGMSASGAVRIIPTATTGPYDIQPVADEEDIMQGNVESIHVDSDGFIWISTARGILKLSDEGEVLQRFSAKTNSTFGEAQYIETDAAHNLWIGTRNHGLAILPNGANPLRKTDSSNDSILYIGQDQGMPSSNVTTVRLEPGNIAWCSTRNGLARLLLDANLKAKTIRVYNSYDGLWTNEINPGAYVRDQKGNYWLGGTNGLTRFYGKAANEKKGADVLLSLEAISVNYVDIRDTANPKLSDVNYGALTGWFGQPALLELPYSFNYISFTFSGILQSAPYRVMYKYKLEGYDPDWTPPTHEHEVIYRGLPPGNYTLKAIAQNADGVWMSQPVTFQFHIKAPFYQTWLFYIIIGILLLSALLIYIRLRERSLRRNNEQLENLVATRTSETVRQKDEIEAQSEIIKQKNHDITSSIEYAQRIQQSILPDHSLLDGFFAERFIYYAPRDIVSGDFYWFAEKDDKIYAAAVDCTGHGVPGAFMSLISFNLLNEALIISSDPLSEILINLRQSLYNQLRSFDKDSVIYDGLDIALICYDQTTKTLTVTNSNRPVFLMKAGEMVHIKSCKLTIGGVNYSTTEEFSVDEYQVQSGDAVYLFTDGITDQFGGPKNRRFSRNALEKLVVNIHTQSMDDQEATIRKTMSDWMGEEQQMDDILIMGLRF